MPQANAKTLSIHHSLLRTMIKGENIKQCMEKMLEEMKERGTNEVDNPRRAPTGEPYRRMQQQALQQHEHWKFAGIGTFDWPHRRIQTARWNDNWRK
jgi:hypothetical protein